MLVAILVTVAALSAAVFLILLVAMIRQVRGITRALQDIQRELVPALERVQADAERTRERLDRITEAQERSPG